MKDGLAKTRSVKLKEAMALQIKEKNVRNIPPSTFTGKYEDWEEFSWRFKAYISLTDSRAAKVLKTAEGLPEPIAEAELRTRAADGTITDIALLASHIFSSVNTADKWATLQHLEINGNIQWT